MQQNKVLCPFTKEPIIPFIVIMEVSPKQDITFNELERFLKLQINPRQLSTIN